MNNNEIENKKITENSLERLVVGVLASGEKVYDRPNGHIHDTVRKDLEEILSRIDSKGKDSVMDSVSLEGKTWKSFKVAINQEKDKENLFLARRNNRKGLSPFVKNREPEITDTVTVILAKNDTGRNGGVEGYTVITAFSGDLAMREPWDPYFFGGKTKEEKEERKREQNESLEYWSNYAFVPDENEYPVDEGTISEYDIHLLRFPFLTEQEKEKQIIYTGLFVLDKQEILSSFEPKHKNVYVHHSTIEFMPKDGNSLEIGKVQKLKIIGRVSDDRGDALLVESPKSNNKYPHITLSCADGVSPMYSNVLIEKAVSSGAVEYFGTPIEIDVVEGYENGNKKVITKDVYLVS